MIQKGDIVLYYGKKCKVTSISLKAGKPSLKLRDISDRTVIYGVRLNEVMKSTK